MLTEPDLYQKISQIGEGTYSKVFSAKNTQTGQVVALKEIVLNADDGAPSTALREIAFLKRLSNHPSILRLIEVLHPKEDSLTLVFERLSLDLRQYMDQYYKRGFPIEMIRLYTQQILSGLEACHTNHIIHRDLKPHNILIDSSGKQVKIGDFGLARGFAIPVTGYSSKVVTLWYRPPEILLGSCQYGASVDMWSLGCIIVEMITGEAIFKGKNCDDQMRRIIKILGSPTSDEWFHLLGNHGHAANTSISSHGSSLGTSGENDTCSIVFLRNLRVEPVDFSKLFAKFSNCSTHLIDLVSNLLAIMPSKRLTAQEALRHPFFSASDDKDFNDDNQSI